MVISIMIMISPRCFTTSPLWEYLGMMRRVTNISLLSHLSLGFFGISLGSLSACWRERGTSFISAFSSSLQILMVNLATYVMLKRFMDSSITLPLFTLMVTLTCLLSETLHLPFILMNSLQNILCIH